MTLVVAHRSLPGPTSETSAPDVAVWRTCLREVWFTDEPSNLRTFEPSDRVFVEGDAYQLLLEILCGLRSPMLGETQVLGQFKTFLASLGREYAWLNKIGQRLLADAASVRTDHLRGLGSRSYGSAVRRHLADCRHAVVIGTGKLAQEVLPFLADDGRAVDEWGRSEEKSSGRPGVAFHALDRADEYPLSSTPTVIIVAAPVAAEVIEHVASRYAAVQRVIDLRADVEPAPLAVGCPVVSLRELFAEMSASQSRTSDQLEAARAEIRRRARRYDDRDELRPFGWDDLCA